MGVLERMSPSEMRAEVSRMGLSKKAKKGRSKYGNTKVVMDGVKHASKKQGLRWVVLRQMEREGKIKDLRREVTYRLEVNGHLVCKYIADHVYDEGGFQHVNTSCGYSGQAWIEKLVVEDVKSEITRKDPVYRIKRKLMAAIHGIDIKEV